MLACAVTLLVPALILQAMQREQLTDQWVVSKLRALTTTVTTCPRPNALCCGQRHSHARAAQQGGAPVDVKRRNLIVHAPAHDIHNAQVPLGAAHKNVRRQARPHHRAPRWPRHGTAVAEARAPPRAAWRRPRKRLREDGFGARVATRAQLEHARALSRCSLSREHVHADAPRINAVEAHV
jgi:hypothetical protein